MNSNVQLRRFPTPSHTHTHVNVECWASLRIIILSNLITELIASRIRNVFWSRLSVFNIINVFKFSSVSLVLLSVFIKTAFTWNGDRWHWHWDRVTGVMSVVFLQCHPFDEDNLLKWSLQILSDFSHIRSYRCWMCGQFIVHAPVLQYMCSGNATSNRIFVTSNICCGFRQVSLKISRFLLFRICKQCFHRQFCSWFSCSTTQLEMKTCYIS